VLARCEPEIHYEQALVEWVRACLGEHDLVRANIARWYFMPAKGTLFGRQHLSRLLMLVEIVLLLGERALAEPAIELLECYESEAFAWGLMAGVYLGSCARRLGNLHALCEQWEEAQKYFELALTKDAPAEVELARTELDFARALARRNRPSDLTRLHELTTRAAERFTRYGLVAQAERAEQLLAASTPLFASPLPANALERATPGFSLAREGDYWALRTHVGTVRLKDSKGLSYLDRLVRHPGREFHVLELASDLHPRAASDLGDAGSLLDSEAKLAYRRRVAELEETVEEAARFGDLARVTSAREELDAIAEQLARAVGLGGRDRRAASAAERARINVQKRLRSTIARIERADRSLGKFLDAAVKTGTYCVFEPPPSY